MVVLLATIREIHETQQIHEINENPDWQVHEIHEIQRQKKGKKPLLLNSYSSHLFRPFSYAGAQHGVNLCESAPLGGIHLVSISKNPPLVPLNNFLYSFTWSQKLPLWPLNNFLHASQLGFNV